MKPVFSAKPAPVNLWNILGLTYSHPCKKKVYLRYLDISEPAMGNNYEKTHKIPLPGQRKAAKPQPLGQTSTCEKALPPPPPSGRNKTEEINQRYTLKRHRNLLKMGISIKQNHLLKLKYSLRLSETVFRIVHSPQEIISTMGKAGQDA